LPSSFTVDLHSFSKWRDEHKGQTNNNNNHQQDSPQKAEEGKPNGTAPAGEEKKKEPTPEEKIKQLEDDVKDWKTKYAYALAEQENIRKIGKQEADKATKYGVQSFAKSILEVADNLSRCLANVKKDDLQNSESLKLLYEGLQMTEKEFLKTLTKNNVSKFDPVGQKFDANTMNALMNVPTPDKTPGTVAFVIKCGYMLQDRLLRPADVAIAQAPQKEQSTEQ